MNNNIIDKNGIAIKKIMACAVGSCVHVAGILNFLNISKNLGYKTIYLGCAVGNDAIKNAIKENDPDIIGFSYRLSPENAVLIFKEIKKQIIEPNKEKTFILGTTKAVADTLKKNGLIDCFNKVFTGGESIEDIKNFLYQEKLTSIKDSIPPQNLLNRIDFKKPFPIIRHHFGRPTVDETVDGIKVISDSGLVDVISLGPDQNAQEYFFEPEKMDNMQDGAGGVPIRNESDLKRLYQATRRGNWPIMRCYSGTNNILKFAEVLQKTINNAWCAVPLCWYNELDRRSKRKLVDAIDENQQVVKWHADRNIPVEINESHHWSLRYAPDSVAVAAAYLAAYNAKKFGVSVYISQYMFNTPPETSFTMDLAKMLAKIDMIESLHDKNFKTIRQTRTGLYSMGTDFNKAKGQLASSTLLQMQVEPQIVHVVAYCESSYAAKPNDIIESCNIVNKVIENCLNGCPDMKIDKNVVFRKNTLISEAYLVIEKIKKLYNELSLQEKKLLKYDDPLIEPIIIAKAINKGILDAPHLAGIGAGCGKINAMFFNGANLIVDEKGNIISEKERLGKIK